VSDTAIPNVSIAFSGSAAPGTSIGTLSFIDAYSNSDTRDQYATQGTSSVSDTREVADGSVPGPTLVLQAPFPTPEPGSLVLLGSGLLAMVVVGLRRGGFEARAFGKSHDS
jgi:hypothetical protein